MAEVVNLRRARKTKARNQKEKAAADNRLRFGVAKRERDLAAARSEKASQEIDAHKLDDGES